MRAILLENLGHFLRLIPRFALLDEVGVLDGARGVEHHRNFKLLAQLADGAQVLHGLRLAARHVDRAGDRHVGNLARAGFVDDAPELGEIDVALERVRVRRVVRFIDNHIDERAPGEFLVQARGGEVHVAGDDVARVNHDLREDVLRAAPLMRGDKIFISIILSYSLPQIIKVLAARISFIPQHQARPLAVAHGVGAAVGEQVDVHVRGAQQEGVVARFGHKLLALGEGGHANRFDHLDLPGFRPGTTAGFWIGHDVAPSGVFSHGRNVWQQFLFLAAF